MDWTKKVGRKQVGRKQVGQKQVGQKLGAQTRSYLRQLTECTLLNSLQLNDVFSVGVLPRLDLEPGTIDQQTSALTNRSVIQ